MLSQTAEYALRAAVYLGEEAPAPRTAHQIAEAVKVPQGYLSKVLQALCRAGVVRSQRGLGGGFWLGVPAEELTVLDVVRVVEPIPRLRTCPLGRPDHIDRLCPLHQQLDDAIAWIENSFRSATIADLVHKPASFNTDNGEARVSSLCCPPSTKAGQRQVRGGRSACDALCGERRTAGNGRPTQSSKRCTRKKSQKKRNRR